LPGETAEAGQPSPTPAVTETDIAPAESLEPGEPTPLPTEVVLEAAPSKLPTTGATLPVRATTAIYLLVAGFILYVGGVYFLSGKT
jgi:hypothetical protein